MEEEFRGIEERYQRKINEKEECEKKIREEMKKEREDWEKQRQEEKREREVDDENKRKKEQKIWDECNQRLEQERQRHEEERERTKMIMEEKTQSNERERKIREEEFREREERYKREIKEKDEQERQMRDEMRREQDAFKSEIEELKKENKDLQIKYDTQTDKLMNTIENERLNHERERKRREEEYKIEVTREREEWEKHKQEEKQRREEDEKEKLSCVEQCERLKSEIEKIMREKEKTEEELEKFERIVQEERNMREVQQKNFEDELKRRTAELKEEYEREKEAIEKVCSQLHAAVKISAYRRLETKYSNSTWTLRSAMLGIETKLHNKIENEAIHEIKERDIQRELKEKYEEINKSMSEFFEKDTNADILIQWKTSFEIKTKELQENIVRETKRKLNEIIQQRDLKKKIDAQRTHHENTLLEKSKGLALKHKDKTNDEESLRREFNLFWEECVKKITTHSPAIRDIDILTDVKELLSENYKSALVDTWNDIRNIFTVKSYSDYVHFKKSGTIAAIIGIFGSILSHNDEAQIRILITDVAQQTDKMIKSYNISKMGYNISYIQQLTGHIDARKTQYEEGHVRYELRSEFFMDLVFSIFKRADNTFTDQHRMFREANDPNLYLEKKREEYYSVFQKYCQGATSAAIFGEIICQKLKEPIEQSKHILKRLAEEENFDKYINYIHDPREYFKDFIRDEVNQFIRHEFSVSVELKMNQNIELLQKQIMTAAHESTQHVQEKTGDVNLWLKFFTQKLSDVLIFSVKDFSGMKRDDVDDFKLLEDVIREELPPVMSDISREFTTDSFDEKLDVNYRSDEILIDHFCQCCWVQCPFCNAICTNTIENHDGDHSFAVHRVNVLNGLYYTDDLGACTTLVASEKYFHTSGQWFLYKQYRRAGGVLAKWSITPDPSELPYWKWFVCRFQKDLEKHYNITFQKNRKIPYEWIQYTKWEAIESLDKY
ncbi:putative interferon-induced very large GTPase 1-like [Triplophysa rosa]|uniref:Interferon-induced very large GTPase 1-like n=1 Tax=Triplophysa rosa TaxID=992332 RepID=A0A9W7TG40_TRIRA|nr:putative interferon-induced very large GTPase 1-like [Triplophysa rosa]